MRVMVIQPGPAFSVADVANGIIGGLEQNGCQVSNLNLNDRLNFYTSAHAKRDDGVWQKCFDLEAALTMAANGIYAECYKLLPEVVVIVSGFYSFPRLYEILHARGHKIVLWCTESPYEDTSQVRQAGYADLCIVNDPTNLDQFRAVQPNTHYIGHAYNPDIHYRRAVNPTYSSDFFFVGTGYPSRRDFFEAVDFSGIKARLAGNWELLPLDSPLVPFLVQGHDECMDNIIAVDWYSNTKASVNVYRREFGEGDTLKPPDAGWAMGPREVELAAMGTFFLTEERGENREILPMVPTFDGPEEFEGALRWWLEHDDSRAEVARQARVAVAGMTFEANTARMLQLLDH